MSQGNKMIRELDMNAIVKRKKICEHLCVAENRRDAGEDKVIIIVFIWFNTDWLMDIQYGIIESRVFSQQAVGNNID